MFPKLGDGRTWDRSQRFRWRFNPGKTAVIIDGAVLPPVRELDTRIDAANLGGFTPAQQAQLRAALKGLF
jgi:hypothetical protein